MELAKQSAVKLHAYFEVKAAHARAMSLLALFGAQSRPGKQAVRKVAGRRPVPASRTSRIIFSPDFRAPSSWFGVHRRFCPGCPASAPVRQIQGFEERRI